MYAVILVFHSVYYGGLGGGARLETLTVSSNGASFLFTWENFQFLLPLGVGFDDLETLGNLPELKDLTAVLLPESGYAPFNPPDWLAGLEPQLYMLSVGAGNLDGLPDKETLDAVVGYTLLRTDRHGWIHLSTDGQQLWVEVERE